MKKILLLALFAGVSYQAAAQLFVRPNATSSTDSYVYVNDQVLYVAGDVNLQINTNDPTTAASVYLRGDGQLIQGSTGPGANQGTGLLSVYQQGFADRYEYNYWASPVGNASAASGNENFGITKLYDVVSTTNSTQALNTAGYDGSSTPLTISNRWIWKYLTGTTYGDWIYVGNSNTIGPGQGFTMKGVDFGADLGSTPQQEYDFRGKPNSGDITNNVIADELTLIGNPYPSAVDLDEFFAGNPDVDATAFYWEQNHETNSHYLNTYEGGYGTWQPGGGPGGTYIPAFFLSYTGSGSAGPPTFDVGTVIERRYAPIGQGFMVRGDVDGTVTMRNEYREFVTEGAANFSQFKNGLFGAPSLSATANSNEAGTEPAKQFPLIRFNAFINDLYAAQIGLLFHDKATFGIDRGFDSKSPRTFENDIFWPLLDDEDNEYIIQTVPFERQAMIPIGFKVEATSIFRLFLAEKVNFNEQLYLFDSLNDTYRPIIKGEYNEVNLEPGLYKDRFFITFEKRVNPADDISSKLDSQIQVFQNNPAKQLEILNNELLNIQSATLFDISGKVIWSKQNLGKQANYSYPTGILTDGIYLLQLATKDGATKVEKIRVFNK